MITHKNILVNGRIVNIPSYMVEVDEENKIKLTLKKRFAKPVSQEIPEEIIVENKEEIIQIGEIKNG